MRISRSMADLRRAARRPLLPPGQEYLAETRTMLAALRTGFTIASGGAIVTLLLHRWPDWVVVVLSTAFVLIGFTLVWAALRRHQVLRARARAEGREVEQPAWLYMPMSVALQVLIVVVLVLYVLRR
jgi:uncharacterized membrane protein YidH (DUF202 family)